MSKLLTQAMVVALAAVWLAGCGGDTSGGSKPKPSGAATVAQETPASAKKPADVPPPKPEDLLEPPPPVAVDKKDGKKADPNKSALILPGDEVENVGAKSPELPIR
jgi:hypothetical protein